jgi:hypothetical protein
MRAIVRFSVDGEANSALRNNLSGVLTRAGFSRNANTATYEASHLSKGDIGKALGEFWRRANGHKGPGRLDHFWMYSDKTNFDDLHPLN